MELRAEGVSRRYYRQRRGSNVFFALKETDLCLTPGELTVLTGPSGSGKSTLLYLLAGLLRPTTGRVLLGGEDLYALGDEARSNLRRAHIGVIPQGQSALASLTVLENVTLSCALSAQPPEEGRPQELLERLGLGELGEVYPGELSGGELRRVSIARALCPRPEILLADEPTGNLDRENTRRVLELLRAYAQQGAAVLLATHEEEAAQYAHRRLTLREGVLHPEPEPFKPLLD